MIDWEPVRRFYKCFKLIEFSRSILLRKTNARRPSHSTCHGHVRCLPPLYSYSPDCSRQLEHSQELQLIGISEEEDCPGRYHIKIKRGEEWKYLEKRGEHMSLYHLLPNCEILNISDNESCLLDMCENKHHKTFVIAPLIRGLNNSAK